MIPGPGATADGRALDRRMPIKPHIVVTADTPRGLGLRELWEYRELLGVLVARDVAVRYQATSLGVVWALLQPAGLVVVFWLVFGRFGRAFDVGVPYPLFALAGVVPWLFVASSVSAAAQSVGNAGGLVSKVYFPRLIIPLAVVGAPLLDLAVGLGLLLLLMLVLGHPLGLPLLAVPLLAALALALAVGLGTIAAVLTVQYRDVRHVLPFAISLWMFLTPVIYPSHVLGEQWRWLVFLNPMSGIVEGFRAALLGGPFPFALLATSLAVTGILLCVGLGYFRHVERRFADLL